MYKLSLIGNYDAKRQHTLGLHEIATEIQNTRKHMNTKIQKR